MKRPNLLACVVLAVGLTAACGGGGSSATPTTKGSGSSASSVSSASSSSASASAGANATGCDLLSDDEVTAVIGAPVTRREPSKQSTPGSFGCVKGTDRVDDLTKGAFVTFSVFGTGGQALLDQLAGESGIETIDGLGDRALLKTAEGFVFVAKGSSVLSVQVFKFGQPGTRDEVIGLARIALSRVP